MKILAIILAAALLASLCSALAAAAPASLEAMYTNVPVTVDGEMDEVWRIAPVSEIAHAKAGAASADWVTDTKGTLRALWNGEKLWLLVDIADATPAYSGNPALGAQRSVGGYNYFTGKNDPNTYASEDGVEFALDFWNDKIDKFQDDDGLFTITREGKRTYELNGMVTNHSSLHAMETNREYSNRVTAWAVKEKADGSGYTVELQLQLFGTELKNGTKLGLDVMIGDSPADGQPRRARVYWSHDDNSLPMSSQDYNADWGEIVLTGWNGTDEFAYDDWKLTNRLRWLDSVSFVKGVWTAETQQALDDARQNAERALLTKSKSGVDAASEKLEAAVAGLRWGDTRYPDPMDLPVQTTLPNIYRFFDGTPVDGTVDWEARRAEILDLAQFYEYGYKPGKPDELTLGQPTWTNGGFDWATFANTPAGWSIPAAVRYGDKTETITFTLALPEGLDHPAPVMLSFGADAQTLLANGIAVLEVPTSVTTDDRNDPWLNTMNRGNRAGTLRSFFPYSRDGDLNEISNEMLAALGASIGADVLEKLAAEKVVIGTLGSADTLIDPGKLAVNGFSINGKYAFVSAVFDDRIDVCIPGAAGATGPAVYRYNVNYPQGGNVYSWGKVTGGEVLGDTIRHNPGRTTELFRRFLMPGEFYHREGSDYGYGCRLPYDHEELVASLVLSPRVGNEKPRAIVLQHTVDDYADQSQGDALSLEIAKTVYDWLGYKGEDYVKFCFRASGGHGVDAAQYTEIAAYLNWYFYDTPMPESTAQHLNTDPFAADIIDGVDGWTRNYGGLEAVAPWLNEAPQEANVVSDPDTEPTPEPARGRGRPFPWAGVLGGAALVAAARIAAAAGRKKKKK